MYYLKPEDVETLCAAIDSVQRGGYPMVLLIVRGLPGMGKSHLGRFMAEKYGGIQYECDQKFTTAGEYVYDPTRIQAAHEMTRQDVLQSMLQAVPLVIVSNTATQKWEYEYYVQMGRFYRYTVVLYDLYLQTMLYIKSSLLSAELTKQNLGDVRDQYLEFLSGANLHGVLLEKIKLMSSRYEFQAEVIEVIAPQCEDSEAEYGQRYLEVLDNGLYVSIALRVAEDLTHEHSAIFWACILASLELLKLFGVASGYRMIHKLIQRNLKSHGARAEPQKEDGGHIPSRKVVKQNAGWAKYHITVLSPQEYETLRQQGELPAFITKLHSLRLDELNDQFLFITQALRSEVAGSEVCPSVYSRVAERLGLVQGKILDTSTSPTTLDDFSASLLSACENGNPVSEDILIEKVELVKRSVGRAVQSVSSAAPPRFSSAFYLLLDKTHGVLKEVQELRNEHCALLPVEWTPHITLAFTHNDVHDTATASGKSVRLEGLAVFKSLKGLAEKVRSEMLDEMGERDAGKSQGVLTDLEEDCPYPLLAELAVHSEVQMTFSYAFCFAVCDVKIRKGPFGDDQSYRSHGVLLKLLPRGLVFLQHNSAGTIYRGIFSMRKFYGKEGMEDDGFGMSAGELNFTLRRQMGVTRSVVFMEKVNGRAGSCRFFSFNGCTLVIVGSKLSHTVGKIDAENRKILLSEEHPASEVKSVITNEATGKLEKEQAVVDERDEEEGALPFPSEVEFENLQYNRSKLVASNAQALALSLNWEALPQLLRWSVGLTINGEVLDPNEMHLVIIDQLQWVVLCTTQFPVEELTLKKEKSPSGPFAESEISLRQSLLDTMHTFAEFFRFIPPFMVHSFCDAAAGDNEQALLSDRVQTTMRLAQHVIFERQTEGKVLYLLDKHGSVLEMMKYKTWWYIYRRSIREVVAKMLARFSKRDENDPHKVDAAMKIASLKQRIEQMSKAKGKSNDAGFQKKLHGFKDELAQLENPRNGASPRSSWQPFVDDIVLEIQRRWPNKFEFVKNEMPEVYGNKVAMAISLAQSFVKFMHELLIKSEKETVVRFRTQYPLLWEEFVRHEQVLQDV
eukprot:RCo028069